METTERFEKAVTKLYNAFNEGTLDSLDCKHCAVGNMCDNADGWMEGSLGEPGRIRMTAKAISTGYSNLELSNIEMLFIYGKKTTKEMVKEGALFYNDFTFLENKSNRQQREAQFKGLCAVVEYLCELDNIPNVMDYKGLFINDKKLEEVFTT